jgi:hypothetical protein
MMPVSTAVNLRWGRMQVEKMGCGGVICKTRKSAAWPHAYVGGSSIVMQISTGARPKKRHWKSIVACHVLFPAGRPRMDRKTVTTL